MKLVNGWWCPDYDTNLDHNVIVSSPSFAGRATYTLEWFLRCLPLIKNFRHGVDVGAHVGLWSWPMSRCFARVSAFEPIPSHAECFRRNLTGIDSVTLHELAMGAMHRRVDMAIKPPWSVKARVRTQEPGAPISVEMVSIDECVPGPVDFLKIDCEGAEFPIIKGGSQTIQRNKPIILIEQKPLNTARYDLGTQAVELLQSWGATVHWEWGGDYCMGWP